jgi:ribosomal protein S18 acetylase RimI-like enzyme
MDYNFREMKIDDYDEVYHLWEKTEGLSLEEGDFRQAIGVYLKRNQGLCFVACADDRIIGTILCGHEGRRGILRHLVVNRGHRGKGIARALIQQSLSALSKAGIKKCNTFVMDDNVEGLRFWEHIGWYLLEDNYRTLQISTIQDK